MSGTRLSRVTNAVKDGIYDNRKEIATVSSQQVASFATTYTLYSAVAHHAPNVWSNVNWLAQSYFAPITGFVARGVINGSYRAATAIATGAEWSLKQVATDEGIDLVAAFANQAIYNGINMLAGRDISEITLAERAVVDEVGTSSLSKGLRFAGDKAAKMGLFNRCTKKNGNENNLDNLNVNLLINEAPSTPKGP